MLLKLESIFSVPQQCSDELAEEVHVISSSASGPILKEILQSCLKKHNCEEMLKYCTVVCNVLLCYTLYSRCEVESSLSTPSSRIAKAF